MNRFYTLFFLFFLLMIHAIGNVIWYTDKGSFEYGQLHGCDTVSHLKNTKIVYSTLKTEFEKNRNPLHFLKVLYHTARADSFPELVNWNWPRLNYLIGSIPLFLGFSLKSTELIIGLFWFGFLIISAYLLGSALLNRFCGVLTAYLISFFPFLFGLTRRFELDLQFSAIILTGLYFFLKSDFFIKRKYSLFFGMAFGFASLIKLQAILFIGMPSLLAFSVNLVGAFFIEALNFNKNNADRAGKNYSGIFFLRFFFSPKILFILKNSLINFFSAFSIFAIIFLLFWSEVWGKLREYQKVLGVSNNFAAEIRSYIGDLLYYLGALIEGVSPAVFFLFLLFVPFMLSKEKKKQSFILLIFFLPPLLMMPLQFLPLYRYIIPILPLFGVMMAFSISKSLTFYNKKIYNFFLILTMLTLLLTFCQWYFISFTDLGKKICWSWSTSFQKKLINKAFISGDDWSTLWGYDLEEKKNYDSVFNELEKMFQQYNLNYDNVKKIAWGASGEPVVFFAELFLAFKYDSFFTFKLLSNDLPYSREINGALQVFPGFYETFNFPAEALIIGSSQNIIGFHEERSLRRKTFYYSKRFCSDKRCANETEKNLKEIEKRIKILRENSSGPLGETRKMEMPIGGNIVPLKFYLFHLKLSGQ